MTENEVIKIFYDILKNGFLDLNLNDVVIKQAYQPTTQGVPTDPTIFFYKVATTRYGYLQRGNTYVELTDSISHKEEQFIESTYSLQALAQENPKDTANPTATDLILLATHILQSDKTRRILNNNGIGIYRITSINNNYFLDDRDRFASMPNVDFTLVYKVVNSSALPEISGFINDIVGV